MNWVVTYQISGFCVYNICNPFQFFPLVHAEDREAIGNMYEMTIEDF